MTNESFDNVSINSEWSSEDISVSFQDEWNDGDTEDVARESGASAGPVEETPGSAALK